MSSLVPSPSPSPSAQAQRNASGQRCAWIVFLLSSPSYVPGILVLAHTFRKYRSRYPLIVAVNPALPGECVEVLREAGLEVRVVQVIKPEGEMTLIAERFADVWTKLRAYEFVDYDRVAMIDGDMMLRQNMDELFDMDLPSNEIAAIHACVCNLDKSAWAPASWTRENCPWTHQTHPNALEGGADPAHTEPHTYTLLNAGLVLLHPSTDEMQRILAFLASPDAATRQKISSWMFPEQDFLADQYRGRWRSLSWRYNGYKTMRYWHGAFWRDDAVKNVHYIIDKPWQRRPARVQGRADPGLPTPPPSATLSRAGTPPPQPAQSGRYTVDHAGKYAEPLACELGKDKEHADAVTHGWWWDEYEEMRDAMLGDEAAGKAGERVRLYMEGLTAK